jgi:DNA-binding NtrC family response regulator
VTGSGPTLLAIDDEPGMLALVEKLACHMNFRVLCHSEGPGALAHISQVRPEVVLVDLQMPEVNGLDMLRAIREIDRSCAVILMTGHPSVQAPWAGNIRELHSVVERACLLGETRMLTERDILAAMTTAQRPAPAEDSRPVAENAGETAGLSDDLLSSVQRTQIDRVLKRVGGNKTQAARLLGISRRSLYRWIDRLEKVGQEH